MKTFAENQKSRSRAPSIGQIKVFAETEQKSPIKDRGSARTQSLPKSLRSSFSKSKPTYLSDWQMF